MTQAAVFDLDGTIVEGDTYVGYLLGYLRRHPERWPHAAGLSAALALYYSGRRDNTWLKITFLRAILGAAERSALAGWTDEFVEKIVSRRVRRAALDRIEHHRDRGDRLVLATASLDFYVEPLAQRLGFDDIVCSRAAWDETGRLTGQLLHGNCYGVNKVAQVKALLERNGVMTLEAVYSDHHSDLPLFELAINRIAVNPTRKLQQQAEQAGLIIEMWK